MARLKDKRVKLTLYFKTLTPNVYFQPPASQKLIYPAIIFNRDDWEGSWANNKLYLNTDSYGILVIDDDPDETIATQILEELSGTSLNRRYISDNLYYVRLVHTTM